MIGQKFAIELGGTVHPAHFYVSAKRVTVLSIYGEDSEPLGREQPEAIARRILARLVQRRFEQKVALRVDPA